MQVLKKKKLSLITLPFFWEDPMLKMVKENMDTDIFHALVEL